MSLSLKNRIINLDAVMPQGKSNLLSPHLLKLLYIFLLISFGTFLNTSYASDKRLTLGPDGYPIVDIEKIHMLSLFKEEKFADLEPLIDRWSIEYQKDFRHEKTLLAVIDSFTSESEFSREIMDKWVKNSPESYIPYLIRGAYFANRAWGEFRLLQNIPLSKRKDDPIRKFSRNALPDLKRATFLNPSQVASYYYLIDLSQIIPGTNVTERYLGKAEEVCLQCYSYREAYLAAISPRWGGSISAMDSYIQKSRDYQKNNLKLRTLIGMTHWARGIEAYTQRKPSAAILKFSDALRFGKTPLYYVWRGKSYQRAARYREALEDYDKALEIDVGSVEILFLRSEARFMLGMMDDALSDVKKLKTYTLNGRKVQEWQRKSSTRLISNGKELSKLRKYKKAIAKFDYSLKFDPSFYEGYFHRGRIRGLLGQYKLAEEDFRRSIELHDNHFESYQALARVLSKKKKYGEALSKLTSYIDKNESHPLAYFERSKIYLLMKDRKNASIDVDRGCSFSDGMTCRSARNRL